MTSSPLERSVTSLAIATNATAEDSGGGVTCAQVSFFGAAAAKAGALASESIPAAPAACRMRRRVATAVIVTSGLPIIVFLASADYSRRILAARLSLRGAQRRSNLDRLRTDDTRLLRCARNDNPG